VEREREKEREGETERGRDEQILTSFIPISVGRNEILHLEN
jgi:hypothetical protein